MIAKAKKAASGTLLMARFTTTVVGLAIMLALVVGVASTALGANEGNFILGQTNVASALTRLTGSVQGASMEVRNNDPGANDTALTLSVQEGEAPMKVDSATRVNNLNADRLDGRDADRLIRVASFNGVSPLPPGTGGTVATTQITAPASGFLVLTAGSDLFNNDQADANVNCRLEVDGAFAQGSQRIMDLAIATNGDEDCSTNAVVPVSAGQHTVDLEATGVDEPGTDFGVTALSAIYVPFGATGSPPSPGAISAAQEEQESLAPRAAREGNR